MFVRLAVNLAVNNLGRFGVDAIETTSSVVVELQAFFDRCDRSLHRTKASRDEVGPDDALVVLDQQLVVVHLAQHIDATQRSGRPSLLKRDVRRNHEQPLVPFAAFGATRVRRRAEHQL